MICDGLCSFLLLYYYIYIYYSSHDGLFDFVGLICLKTKQRQKWLLAALKLKSRRIGAL